MASNAQQIASTRAANVMASTAVEWNIENFHEIYRNDLVNKQKFVLKTNHIPSTTCSWEIGLFKPHWISLYCQLCEITGDLGTRKQYFQCTATDSAGTTIANSCKILPSTVNERVEVEVMFTVGTVNSPFPPDGKLILNLKVYSILPDCTEEQASDSIEETQRQLATASLHNLQDNMVRLLTDEESSDVKIITSDQMNFPGHKLILQAQNLVFASMLRSDLSESRSGIIKVDDVCGKTMSIILHYVYTGELLPTWNDVDTIVEFAYAAGKYQLTEVLKMLDASLGIEFTEEHVSSLVPLLSLANKLSLKKAEKRLLSEIQKKTAKAESSEEILALMGAQVSNITM